MLPSGLFASFQSTCPRGARPPGCDRCGFGRRFQSTCPRGARLRRARIVQTLRISIHVPTRGTTVRAIEPLIGGVFQSTCPRGARLPGRVFPAFSANFNPRAHEGHDVEHPNPTLLRHFNPRAHEGHDCGRCLTIPRISISIHVPTRGTT